ncbi:MAG: hypothetical protein H6760_02135 [Candidatus Nomurabacteria bacterium]|nr:MAG: hypothetical protein H6760_02135 [Candidatus Nomurabacteria bacterium]
MSNSELSRLLGEAQSQLPGNGLRIEALCVLASSGLNPQYSPQQRPVRRLFAGLSLLTKMRFWTILPRSLHPSSTVQEGEQVPVKKMVKIMNHVEILKNTPLLREFRLATAEDIAPGAELFEAEVGFDLRIEQPRRIRLADEPIQEAYGEDHVVYSQANGLKDLTVTVQRFLSTEAEPETLFPHRYTILYLVKI